MAFPSPRPCSLFLFDLDGTLIDSREDITTSLNIALGRMGLNPLPEARVTKFVGSGVQVLVERSLREVTGSAPPEDRVRLGIALFKEEYGIHLLDRTHLYPGVKESLDHLCWARFAVVSNKPEIFCRRILDGLGVGMRFLAILGGDSALRKPDPASLLKAMEFCRANPHETVMVGDSPVDIQAGKAAGVMTCGVLGGFHSRADLEAAGSDLLVHNLLDLVGNFCASPP